MPVPVVLCVCRPQLPVAARWDRLLALLAQQAEQLLAFTSPARRHHHSTTCRLRLCSGCRTWRRAGSLTTPRGALPARPGAHIGHADMRSIRAPMLPPHTASPCRSPASAGPPPWGVADDIAVQQHPGPQARLDTQAAEQAADELFDEELERRLQRAASSSGRSTTGATGLPQVACTAAPVPVWDATAGLHVSAASKGAHADGSRGSHLIRVLSANGLHSCTPFSVMQHLCMGTAAQWFTVLLLWRCMHAATCLCTSPIPQQQ